MTRFDDVRLHATFAWYFLSTARHDVESIGTRLTPGVTLWKTVYAAVLGIVLNVFIQYVNDNDALNASLFSCKHTLLHYFIAPIVHRLDFRPTYIL